MRSLY